MIRPYWRSSIVRPAACENRNAPVRLMSITFCHFSSGIASGRAPQLTPALLIRMSTSPYPASVLSTTACTWTGFATSQIAASTRTPRARSASTVGVSHSSRRAQSMSAAPASARPSAISRPRPRDPPVTIAARPDRSNSSLITGMGDALIRRPGPRCQRFTARESGGPACVTIGRFFLDKPTPQTAAAGVTGAHRGAMYTLAVLFAINLMNFFDRQILGAVGEEVRREWALSDTALGLLGTVFTLLYAVVGVPLGRLSDRTERRRILSAGVFVWSVLTAVSGCAQSFSQMVVARLGVGVGEATCSPASTSLIGDLFPGTRRARAVAVWMLGLPLGLGLANGLGGWIAAKWGWRMAFYVAAVPGLLCAVSAWLIRAPERGRAEERAAGEGRPGASP